MNKILILLVSAQVIFPSIYYDTGLARNFDMTFDSSFNCKNGYSRTATISFSNEFSNIPQVFFVPEYNDFETPETEFQLSMTTITKTSFTAIIKCSRNRVFTIQLRWFAIDDQRIEVIYNFNMQNPDDKTFSIKNPNAQTGFVVLTSLHYTGQVEFLLSISQIITNSVTVSITKVAGKFTNLKQIGYIVVVGIEEAFINLGLKRCFQQWVTCIINKQMVYGCPTRFKLSKYQQYKNKGNIYQNCLNNLIYLGHMQYYKSILMIGAEIETPNTHSQIWVAYQFTKSYKALECFTVRTSRKEVLDLSLLPTFHLELVSLNQIYTTNGNYDYLMDITIAQLKTNLQVKCENGKKIQADFNKCNSCSTKKTHSFTYNCFNKMNYVGFFPQFKQEFQQYNKLKIIIQSSQLEIIQTLYDQQITEQTIMKIQILNQ